MTGAIHRWNVDATGHKISSTPVITSQPLAYDVVAY
jgi:hypothetical protein